MFEKVVKRNGEVVEGNRSKIEEAILKALVMTQEERSRAELRKLSEVVTD